MEFSKYIAQVSHALFMQGHSAPLRGISRPGFTSSMTYSLHSNASPSDHCQPSLLSAYSESIGSVEQESDPGCAGSLTEYPPTNESFVELFAPYASANVAVGRDYISLVYPPHDLGLVEGHSQFCTDPVAHGKSGFDTQSASVIPVNAELGLQNVSNPNVTYPVFYSKPSPAGYSPDYVQEYDVSPCSPLDSADHVQNIPVPNTCSFDSSQKSGAVVNHSSIETRFAIRDNSVDADNMTALPGTGGSQPQAATKAANETTSVHHYLVDLKDTVDDTLRKICFRCNGNGIFRCCLPKCAVAWRGPFSTIQEMDQHIHDMIQDRRFVCGLCKESFKNKSDCTRHVDSKNNPDQFPCLVPGCGKKCGRKDALKQHMGTCHEAYHWQIFSERGV